MDYKFKDGVSSTFTTSRDDTDSMTEAVARTPIKFPAYSYFWWRKRFYVSNNGTYTYTPKLRRLAEYVSVNLIGVSTLIIAIATLLSIYFK